ncbi:molybdopterin molybdotransferase MoeA [Campylobacter sp. MIT 97-5078]|uniref:molybdopterin molybdotransferase MoeA n=1 Tax=Campylobacter sp. MIT 97-5078 TaxID=1548153 RepID=UPI000512C149|nr:molybdopterin molybdotransferase MoeA [Campylobacter sp. MIT 97-5078]KGI56071.1 molybdenum cofactor biosynthesis protein MoaA [Campylobacter sp. MIT 97-5078]TQR27725.1 molybdopterin molybdenumtransferase MoeA [Campylobacter sp. MIT 97-5078]
MLEYFKALEVLKKRILPYENIEKIAITQCLGRILAEDIRARADFPAFKTASMDGYAFKFSEQNEPLTILGKTAAGQMPSFKLKSKECVKTFTGSLLCEGADTLVPVENARVEGDLLFIEKRVTKGFAVRQVGESYRKDELLLSKGTRLDYSELALLAELGFFHISVFIKPKVGILSSGDELKDLGETLENPAQIYSSNHLALANLVQKFGGEPLIFPLLKDEAKEVSLKLKNALKSCDLLITTGGVSMGDFDLLKQELLNYEILVDKVSIKPGRHIKIAVFEDKFILALPGFAYSAMVTFHLFARMILNHWLLQGELKTIKAFLKQDYTKKSPLLECVACNLSFEEGKVYVDLEGKKAGSSAILANLNHNAALLIAPLEAKELKKGDLVKVLLLG